jgi:hypothetical protein
MNPSMASATIELSPSEISLPISFSTPKKPRTKYITFDVVDMLYPYDAFFGQGPVMIDDAAKLVAICEAG